MLQISLVPRPNNAMYEFHVWTEAGEDLGIWPATDAEEAVRLADASLEATVGYTTRRYTVVRIVGKGSEA